MPHLQHARRKQVEMNKREWRIGFGNYSFQVPVLKDKEQRKRFVALEHPHYR